MKLKIIKLILIVATIIILLFASFIIILKFTWKPDIMVKDIFSAADISLITSELSIEGKIEISKMQYTHAKDSVFHIYADSDSLSFLKIVIIIKGAIMTMRKNMYIRIISTYTAVQ
ncbi:MAG: hypothetical protein IKK66_02360 [Ruminococcus sp.]|nr:hypothetical protein [Ruminococcus sp.]